MRNFNTRKNKNMAKVVNFKFLAFIPGSLGTRMSNQNIPFRNIAPNSADLNTWLRNIPGTWKGEPGTYTKFYKTDDREFTQAGTNRVLSEANLDLSSVGKYNEKRTNYFTHLCDASHQCKAEVKNHGEPKYPMYYAYYSGPTQQRGTSQANVDKVENKLTGTYFTTPGTIIRDTTIIKTEASAGYPFAEPFSPNIDWEIRIEMYDRGSSIRFNVSGYHNKFPFYELLVDNQSKYKFQSASTDPGLINLNSEHRFNITFYINK